jgi:hypothetical protein
VLGSCCLADALGHPAPLRPPMVHLQGGLRGPPVRRPPFGVRLAQHPLSATVAQEAHGGPGAAPSGTLLWIPHAQYP